MIRFVAALLALMLALPVLAQETPEEERGFFIDFVENQLSADNRQIRINGIQGVLSSSATIREITIADREGVWLRISNAGIDWNRSALLRGRLDIETLRADAIEVLRQPLPAEGLPSPEATPFRLPDLPLAISLRNLEIERLSFGQDVFGLASELRATGNLEFADGSLQTALDMRRLDGPGGNLTLTASYANATEVLDVRLGLNEPANGIVANLLSIEGRPPVDLVLSGSGPIGDLALELTLDADGARVLTGTTRLDRTDVGLAFSSDVRGPISRLVAPAFRDFFGDEASLTVNGTVRDEGGFAIERLSIDSAAVDLEASAETGADGFLRSLQLDARIEPAGDDTVVLPVPGGSTTLRRGVMSLTFGDTPDGRWSGTVSVTDLASPQYKIDAIALDLGGIVGSLDDPTNRRITFDVTGQASGIEAEREDIAEALGSRIELAIRGGWSAGQPVRIERASVDGRSLSLTAAGSFLEGAFTGDIGLEASNIAPFSGLAGRDLGGGARLTASGEVRPVSGAFDLTLDGQATELRIGDATADNLLSGTNTITGRVARGEAGLVAENFRLDNPQATLTANGRIATGSADFRFDVAVPELAEIREELGGRMTATGTAQGADGVIALAFAARVPSGSLTDRSLRDGSLAFDGTLSEGRLAGNVTGDAFLDGTRVSLRSQVLSAGGERRLNDLRFETAGAVLTGNIAQRVDGLLNGALDLDAPNVSTAAALALARASGAIRASVDLSVVDDRQSASVDARVDGLVYEDTRIGAATVQARVADLFGVPAVEGRIEASRVTAAGIDIATLTANARRSGDATGFTAQARLDNGATVDTTGSLAPEGAGFRLTLEQANLAWRDLSARLSQTASLKVEGQDVTIDSFAMTIGGGTISATGTIAERMDVSARLSQVPLAIANAIRPDLGLGGTIDGTAVVGGSRSSPNVRFDLAGRGLTASALRAAGLSTLSVDARGTTSGDRLNVEASVSGPEGFRAQASGGVPLGDGSLALDVTLQSFPLATLNPILPGQSLSGNVTGSATVTGRLSDPAASFNLSGNGLASAQLVELGVAPLGLTASGRYADGAIALASAAATGPRGLSVTASGNIPLSGGGLAVTANGQVPLELANRFLPDRGTQVSGTLVLDVRVAGSLSDPVVTGTISTAGASAVDPEANVRLNDIALSASLDAQSVTISRLSASVSGGGRLSANGTISLADGFPADLDIQLQDARYTDGELVVATVDASLSVFGSLARDPLISGQVSVKRAEISIAGDIGGGPTSIDVIHISPPPAVRATLQRARANDGTPMPSARPSVARFDVTVRAPNQIFVRGRGLDAELGGQVRLTGPVTDIQPVGGFDLIRGRLSILGQRITFDEGSVTLVGDLNPFIDFVARSESDDITVFVTVRGRVSDPQVTFSSQPELPQDEVLARLIFNRSISELSALQIAQLAAAAAELAGGSNTSLVGGLRDATGLDDLDIVTDSEGNTAVRAGRYIQDNIYLGVEAGAAGSTRGTINLDITQDLKARGSVGSDGDSSLGLFFERDY
ncbi:MAG: translocation/assembly module TamB domain-containing protein [Mesorhizobium sp.]